MYDMTLIGDGAKTNAEAIARIQTERAQGAANNLRIIEGSCASLSAENSELKKKFEETEAKLQQADERSNEAQDAAERLHEQAVRERESQRLSVFERRWT